MCSGYAAIADNDALVMFMIMWYGDGVDEYNSYSFMIILYEGISSEFS